MDPRRASSRRRRPRGACLDMVRVGTYAPSYVELGPQRALQEAHRRRRRSAAAACGALHRVPIAFTTGGSFFEPTLRRAMSQWGALRLALRQMLAGDDRELISAQRCVGLRWRCRAPLRCGGARDGVPDQPPAAGSARARSALRCRSKPLSDYVGTAAEDTRPCA